MSLTYLIRHHAYAKQRPPQPFKTEENNRSWSSSVHSGHQQMLLNDRVACHARATMTLKNIGCCTGSCCPQSQVGRRIEPKCHQLRWLTRDCSCGQHQPNNSPHNCTGDDSWALVVSVVLSQLQWRVHALLLCASNYQWCISPADMKGPQAFQQPLAPSSLWVGCQQSQASLYHLHRVMVLPAFGPECLPFRLVHR